MKKKAVHILGLGRQEPTMLKVKRPKGGEVLGTLYKGCTTNAFSRHNCGSIPSPSQATMVQRPEARTQAFGSACNRFSSQQLSNSMIPASAPTKEQTPGPGTYHSHVDVTSSIRTDSESFSRLGYGVGFASKTSRFGGVQNRRNYPGPGSYLGGTPAKQLTHSQSYHALSKSQSQTILKSAKKPQRIKQTPVSQSRDVIIQPITKITPGPGAYEVENNLKYVSDSGKLEGHSSAFLSGSQRISYLRVNQDSPGPGLYDQHLGTIQADRGIVALSGPNTDPPPSAARDTSLPDNAKSTMGLLTENVKLKRPLAQQFHPALRHAFKKQRQQLMEREMQARREALGVKTFMNNEPSPLKIKGTTSSFKLPLKCRKSQPDMYNLVTKSKSLSTLNPGPGSYDNQMGTIEQRLKENSYFHRGTSSMFSAPAFSLENTLGTGTGIVPTQNMGGQQQYLSSQEEYKRNVGPGLYDPSIAPLGGDHSKVFRPSASFASHQDRVPSYKPKAPGPAFYHPKILKKNDSFNNLKTSFSQATRFAHKL